ncbi:MAG: 23S rRNA (cytosine1962-C5)-methyltransferase [Cognaticolwellia sp.]|jgi:23S rRNA (cytosine1962-C5)-methyltransferase
MTTSPLGLEDFSKSLASALERRAAHIPAWEAEGSDSYRVFHGRNEGRPGLSIDRYGAVLLAQTWGEEASDEEKAAVQALLGEVQWRHRGAHGQDSTPFPFQELGVQYQGQVWHKGADPWLFLDLRVVRRWLLANCTGKRVLNTFAYTCGAGLCAAKGGASTVLNVDHSAWALELGRVNAASNEVEMEALRGDFFDVVRQLGGNKLRGGAKRRSQMRVKPQAFDVVVLDPPTLSKGRQGAVDINRDYPSLLKPCLQALAPNGQLIATHHSVKVDREAWLEIVLRCAAKAERPVVNHEWLEPEMDFPSPDGKGNLKILKLDL